MTERDDHQLLAEFARENSEAAFAALVQRHVNLVYATALRSVGNAHAAEEISQAVFIILAQKAGKLSSRVVISGWLYQTTRLTAANFLRGEIRRQQREQEAYMQSTLNDLSRHSEATAGTENIWPQIAPLLDDALAKLGEADRNAIVLRFLENKSLAEVGAALGASEDAVKMRVNRALEKLRKLFTKRGVARSATLIAGAVSAGSVQAAPVGLAKTISAVAITKGAAAGGSTLALVKGVLKLMAWTKMKTAIVAGAVVLLAAGTGIYEAGQYYHQKAVYFPRDAWAPSGFATPEAVVKSFMWAKSVGDIKTVLDMATPDVRKTVEDEDFKNKSDQARSAILIENVKNVTGIQIQKKMILASDWIVLQLHTDGMPKQTYAKVTMKKIDGEWKISGVEEHR